MALIRKIDPAGIDFEIDRLQKWLYNRLANLSDWQSYHRAYKTQVDERRITAEVYVGDEEYEDCFYNDNFDTTSFFITADEINYVEGDLNECAVSWIIQLKLNRSYPGIEHRADEELRNDVVSAFKDYNGPINLTSTETGIRNVYREFDTSKIVWDDMSNVHVLRVNFDLRFKETCCTNC